MRRQGGFTMIEIMVSLGLLVIGLAGVLALHTATVRGNRVSRQLERARVLAVQLMEDLRGRPMTILPDLCTGDTIDTIEPVEGAVYSRSCTLTAVTGAADLRLLVARVSFPSDDDDGTTHEAALQMLRTVQENL
jgi:prepilin-type N-terminal cleavage/methylation domain-containing protein